MHGLTLGILSAIALSTWLMPAGWVAAAVGVTVGTFGAERMHAEGYRLRVAPIGSALSVLLGYVLHAALTDSVRLAALLSPLGVLRLSESVLFALLGFGFALTVRRFSLQYRIGLGIEAAAAVLAIATSVAAHREGMIARPLSVADWFWRHGVDPVLAFLGIGVGAAVVLAGLLVRGRSARRSLASLFLVLAFGFIAALHMHGLNMGAAGAGADGSEAAEDKGRHDASGGRGYDTPKEDDGLPPAGDGPKARPAAIVVFHREVMPFSGVFYFRHAAFSQYNGVRLVEASQAGIDQDARHDFPVRDEMVPGPQATAAHRSAVAMDVALLTPHSRLFALLDPTEISPMANPEPARFVRAYHVVSNVLTGSFDQLLDRKAGDKTWPADVWAYYTEAPRDPRYRALAEHIRGELKAGYESDPLAIALAVKRYLEETSTYSFVHQYEGDDPTGDFLFSPDRKGYCVHLANALAFLVRTLGVPARVSAGYAVAAENLNGGSALLIKSGDAHAWGEIHLDGVGWVPIEVTPEKSDVQPPPFQEADLQQLLGEMARKEGRTSPQAHEGFRLGALLSQLQNGAAIVLLAFVIVLYAIKAWRLWCACWAKDAARTRLAYRSALDRLTACGWTRWTGESRERFARRASSAAPSFERLSAIHLARVFGREHARARDETSRVDACALAREVGREVSRTTPRWRWIIGCLNPFSWMATK
ncbi:MAG: transglutaminase domain-containing protein [Deltaproteobacteria bacterium]|nr:transglutaminase domain-containing protein [Deltaproteobacteria bacterium]